MGQYHHKDLITTKPSLEWDITTTKSGMGHCHHKGLLQKQVWNGILPLHMLTTKPSLDWDITISHRITK